MFFQDFACNVRWSSCRTVAYEYATGKNTTDHVDGHALPGRDRHGPASGSAAGLHGDASVGGTGARRGAERAVQETITRHGFGAETLDGRHTRNAGRSASTHTRGDPGRDVQRQTGAGRVGGARATSRTDRRAAYVAWLFRPRPAKRGLTGHGRTQTGKRIDFGFSPLRPVALRSQGCWRGGLICGFSRTPRGVRTGLAWNGPSTTPALVLAFLGRVGSKGLTIQRACHRLALFD